MIRDAPNTLRHSRTSVDRSVATRSLLGRSWRPPRDGSGSAGEEQGGWEGGQHRESKILIQNFENVIFSIFQNCSGNDQCHSQHSQALQNTSRTAWAHDFIAWTCSVLVRHQTLKRSRSHTLDGCSAAVYNRLAQRRIIFLTREQFEHIWTILR